MPWLGGLRHRNHGESRVWGADPRPRPQAPGRRPRSLATACSSLLAIPAFGMHTINPGVAGLPRSLPIMQTYDRIQAAFPGGPLPAVIVVQADDVTRARGAGRRSRSCAAGARLGQTSAEP